MNLTFYGHAACQLHVAGHELLIDPFLSDNPHTDADPAAFSPSFIILTHGHGDHYGDVETIAQKSGATVISSFEIVNYLSAKGITGHGMNPGGGFDFPFGRVKFTPAWHSNSLPDGSYGGMPMGVVIEAEGKRLYHAGDTVLFGDMALIAKGGIDLALLPIGDNFTMGPDDALEAVRLLNPKQVIPTHYDTFDLIKQDAQAFKRQVETHTESRCTVLAPNETLEL